MIYFPMTLFFCLIHFLDSNALCFFFFFFGIFFQNGVILDNIQILSHTVTASLDIQKFFAKDRYVVTNSVIKSD